MHKQTPGEFESLWSTLGGEATLNAFPIDATIRADAATVTHPRATADLPRISLSIGADPTSGSPPPAASDWADIVLGKKLGEGGMGQVFLAQQRSLGRDIAVKLVRADAENPETVAALLHEARTTGALEHPNIVPVHALGLGPDGQPVMVMKRVEGVSWHVLVYDADHPAWQRLPMRHDDPLVTHIEVLIQVCNALLFAHTRGVIHRDLKLENVMIGEFGEVYLLDWGIALRVPAPARTDGERPRLVGTPAYMAPEMVEGYADAMDARTDVYLLGAMLHEVLTRSPRHEGRTLHEVLLKAFMSDPVTYGPSVPSDLATLCASATERDPDKRPANVSAFRQRLADYLRHRASLALSDSAARSLERLLSRPGMTENQPEALASPETWGLLTECRFGFLQALREWSGNDAARMGLQAVLERMVEREISLKNPAAARGFLEQLSTPRADLAARIDALEADVAKMHREAAELQTLRKEMDVRVSSSARAAVAGAMTGLAALMVVVVFAVPSGPTGVSLEVLSFGANIVVLLLLLAVGFAFRRKFLANTINRRLSLLLLTMGVYFIAVGGVTLLLGPRPADSAPFGFLELSGMMACTAIVSLPALRLQAAIAFAGAVATALRPDLMQIPAVTMLALVASLLWLLRTGRIRPHAGDVIG